MSERRFIHKKEGDYFFEVIERQENGTYLCVHSAGRTVPFVVTPNWPLVGLSEAAAGRLRGATVYTKTQAAMEE
jgi:hypothetical protein